MLSSRDHFRDHFGIFCPIGRTPEKKKARGYGLFKWSECTDLTRGPLVPRFELRGSLGWAEVGKVSCLLGFDEVDLG